jgi:hypothetical protein
MRKSALIPLAGLWLLLAAAGTATADPGAWQQEWPDTDFTQHSVDFSEIMSGGVRKDQIPALDSPVFKPVAEVADIGPQEPVIGLVVGGLARAYPLRVLTWHEIVNDEIAGIPVAVTYCPLCNAAIVFDRRVGDQVLDFGTTGKLRNSDLVMYDRQTESWWQQFLGQAIVGELTGAQLTFLPARLESWERFAARHPEGEVLVPNNPNSRSYGANPYVGYDGERFPFLYRGEYPEGIEPMARVVAVGDEAWALSLIREKGQIESGELLLSWYAGQNSALDTRQISRGRDVGNVVVRRRSAEGLVDVPYDVTFAFVFHAFRPEGVINR